MEQEPNIAAVLAIIAVERALVREAAELAKNAVECEEVLGTAVLVINAVERANILGAAVMAINAVEWELVLDWLVGSLVVAKAVAIRQFLTKSRVEITQLSSMRGIVAGWEPGLSIHHYVSIAAAVMGAIAVVVAMAWPRTARKIAAVQNIEEVAELRPLVSKLHYFRPVHANRQNYASISVNFSIVLTVLLRTPLPMCKVKKPVAREK